MTTAAERHAKYNGCNLVVIWRDYYENGRPKWQVFMCSKMSEHMGWVSSDHTTLREAKSTAETKFPDMFNGQVMR